MNCCQCQGIEEIFNKDYVDKEVQHYRRKGPAKTTRMLVEAIRATGVKGMTLLDIGGGVGAIQHALMEAGVERVTSVEASQAYLGAAKEESQRRGLVERVAYEQGDFVELVERIEPADIVTLDRVICCYHDVENLVRLSARRAKKLYGVVFPKDTWWIKLALILGNLFLSLSQSSYRAYVHPTREVERILGAEGLRKRWQGGNWIWQVVVYARKGSRGIGE